MYHPTTRLLSILELLQAHDRLSGPGLARRLGVDGRSVRRYVMMLQDLGIPVEAVRGVHGGYRLRPGYKLPPLIFTEDEAFALTLALLATPRLGLAFAAPAIEGARAKLERVLPPLVRARVQAVGGTVALDATPVSSTADPDLVALFAQAAHLGRRVWLRYRSSDGGETERAVDPYGVACWSRYWYAVGHCHLRGGLRMFRLDRALAAELRDEAFPPQADFDARDYVVRSLATMPGIWTVEVLLGLTLDEARRRIPAAFATLEQAATGVLFRCHYDDLDQLARYLVSLGCALAVREPPELREAFRRLALELAQIASQPGPAVA